MPVNDYELGRQVGEVLSEVKSLSRDTAERHQENIRRFNEIEKAASSNAERVNTLWAFRNRIIAIGGAVALAAGFVAHFLSDFVSSVLQSVIK